MAGSSQSFDGVNQDLGGYHCIDSPDNNTSDAIHSINDHEHFNELKLIREIFLCKPISEWSW